MRRLMIAALMAATLASPITAQRLPAPPLMAAPPAAGGWAGAPVAAPPLRAPGLRWGGTVEGRWWGGMRAPGGWHAYRRPARGFVVPGYWLAPDFVISDFVEFGLDSPPYGYHWARYYDDAVLIDDGGHVWDSVHGLDWDRLDRVAGQRYADRDRYEYRVERGADYPPPPAPFSPAPIRTYSGTSDGYTQSFVAGSGGSYVLPAGVTTITIESAPVVTTTTTTTTTEYVETYRRRAVRQAYAPHRTARRCCCCCR